MATKTITCPRCEERFNADAKDVFDQYFHQEAILMCPGCTVEFTEKTGYDVIPIGVYNETMAAISLRNQLDYKMRNTNGV